MTEQQKKLRKRILELSYKHKLSHLGSCLSAIDLIEAIFEFKKKDERFVLSNGHAAVALYTVLESHGLFKNLDRLKMIPVHPHRNSKLGIDVSTGSLGLGLSIALGLALSNREKNVYCMISDGECAEGIIWESFRVAQEQNLTNLKIILNANGWGAYDPINTTSLIPKFRAFGLDVVKVQGHNKEQILKTLNTATKKPLLIFAKTTVEHFPFLKGQAAHYHIMNEKDYQDAMENLR